MSHAAECLIIAKIASFKLLSLLQVTHIMRPLLKLYLLEEHHQSALWFLSHT